MRDEYDFKGGVRGKYAKRFSEGTNLVLLDPDVAKEFSNSRAVNDALREILARRHAQSAEAKRHNQPVNPTR